MTFQERDLERRLKQLGPQFRRVYTEAKRDLDKKLEKYIAKFRKEDAEKRRLLAAGEITQDQYDTWKMGAVFQGKMWRARANQMAETLENADKEALKLIRGEQMDIFAEGFNHEQFELEKATGVSVNFGLYDAETVGNLIQNEPELLPRKVVNGKKADAWNRREIANAVTQGIIQGESVDKIAARIARDTAQKNGAATMRYARTALTGAQNSGRVECMKRAEGMGIKVQKQWLATMDRKTRDSHRHLDGQTVDVDKPFKSDFGLIRFPGDPEAAPGDVYNCRCTLISVYPKYKEFEEDWRRNVEIDGQTYEEWKKGKKAQGNTEEPNEPTELEKKVRKAENTPHKLTDAEHQAVEDYVSGDMMFINQILRGRAGDLTEDDKEFVKLMDSALSDPLGKEQTLFRSVDAEAIFGKISDGDYQNLNTYFLYGKNSFGKGNYADEIRKRIEGIVSRAEGNTITENGYMSTTKDKEIAFDWGGFTGSEKPIVLEIKAPPETKGRDLKEFDIEGDEQQEVLLARGQRFKITGIHGENGSVVVTVEIVKKGVKDK